MGKTKRQTKKHAWRIARVRRKEGVCFQLRCVDGTRVCTQRCQHQRRTDADLWWKRKPGRKRSVWPGRGKLKGRRLAAAVA